MKEQAIVSIDIGTQGTKAGLVQLNGRILAQSFIPSRLIRKNGVVEQDPGEIVESIVSSMSRVIEQAGPDVQVTAIGIDGQMAGVMGIDEDWNAVTPFDSWLDTRCEAYMPIMKAAGEEALIRTTGCPVTYAHGPKIIWWKHEHPETFARVAKFVTLSAFAAGKLAGLKADKAFIDYTHLHFAGFGDSASLSWSESILKEFGIPADKMPAIVEPWTIVGKLDAAYAAACGLPAGIPIIAGCGDTAASILGSGIVEPGLMFDVAGTASVLACGVDTYTPDDKHKTLIYSRSVLPGLWTPLAYINGGGQCLEWFREQQSHSGKETTLEELGAEAEAAAGAKEGLYFVPHFGGRVCPNNPLLRGAWVGLSWQHGRGSLYRSILESIAFEYKQYLTILQSSAEGFAPVKIYGVGGGTRSALFNRLKADVLQVPYATLVTGDTSLLANAVIAGYGTGQLTDIAATIRSFQQEGSVTMPDPGLASDYASYAGRYGRLLDGMTAVFLDIHSHS